MASVMVVQSPEKEASSEGLNMAAEDLIKAVMAKDAVAVAAALKAAYTLCDSYNDSGAPDEE